MPGLDPDPGIHAVTSQLAAAPVEWIAGSSPAMTSASKRLAGQSPRVTEARGAGHRAAATLLLRAATRRPAQRHRFRPLPRLSLIPRKPRTATAEIDLGLPAEARENRRPEAVRYTGRSGGCHPCQARPHLPSRLSSSAAAQAPRGGTVPDHASLMEQGWGECKGGAEGGDRFQLSLRLVASSFETGLSPSSG